MERTYTPEDAFDAARRYFDGDDDAARLWIARYASKNADGAIIDRTPADKFNRLVFEAISQQLEAIDQATARIPADNPAGAVETRMWTKIRTRLLEMRTGAAAQTRKRPTELEADIVRFQNNKEKWIAFVGLVNGHPYEIFTGLADDDDGLFIPKSVSHGKIIKAIDSYGNKRYDFQFINKRGHKTTIEGLNDKFNPEYWNYAKLISGVLRYGMPIEQVIKMVDGLELDSQSINTWKAGVERALKKYIPSADDSAEDTIAHEQILS